MSTHLCQSFDECLSPDGKTFTLSRVGTILAAAWLQGLLYICPCMIELILNQVEFVEWDLEVLNILSHLASTTRNWKCWKFTNCPNLADINMTSLHFWNQCAEANVKSWSMYTTKITAL